MIAGEFITPVGGRCWLTERSFNAREYFESGAFEEDCRADAAALRAEWRARQQAHNVIEKVDRFKTKTGDSNWKRKPQTTIRVMGQERVR